jgi:arsenite methyltransferase
VTTIDVEALEAKVKQMYRLVAEQPHGNYHFELGRSLAERLGSHPELLHRIPAASRLRTAGTSSASHGSMTRSRKRSGQPATRSP